MQKDWHGGAGGVILGVPSRQKTLNYSWTREGGWTSASSLRQAFVCGARDLAGDRAPPLQASTVSGHGFFSSSLRRARNGLQNKPGIGCTLDLWQGSQELQRRDVTFPGALPCMGLTRAGLYAGHPAWHKRTCLLRLPVYVTCRGEGPHLASASVPSGNLQVVGCASERSSRHTCLRAATARPGRSVAAGTCSHPAGHHFASRCQERGPVTLEVLGKKTEVMVFLCRASLAQLTNNGTKGTMKRKRKRPTFWIHRSSSFKIERIYFI